MAIIKAENVSIRYITGDFKDIGLKEYVMRRLKGNYRVTEFWADRNISFELEKGDMLGIIGTNGAGKSTLLKAVSGIMVPTEGHMEIKGSIAALLELGSGFDGDLTVRENTYLRGAMLGYTRQFMDEMYDHIIDFAELHDFQERPFKQLSSGMKSRLAFSIACLVNPDILILDEVLSVGDGAFRQKSGDKMKEILARGVTGILVSHSIAQVREMCNKILWIDHGRQIAFTDEKDLYCDAYEEFLITKKLPQSREDVENLAAAYAHRLAKEREKARRTETQRLQAILEAGSSEHAVQAAVNVINKKHPEMFKDYIPPHLAAVIGPGVVADDTVPLPENIRRIYGGSRFETAVIIADMLKKQLNKDKFDCIVLADGHELAESFSAGYLAFRRNAPLIPVNEEILQKILEFVSDNLEPKGRVYIVGNMDYISEEMLEKICNCTAMRVTGSNIAVVNQKTLRLNRFSGGRIAVCNAANITDGISMAATGIPVLMVNERLDDRQRDYISAYPDVEYCIIGGVRAVNETVEAELSQYGRVKRINGASRYETSALIAEEFFPDARSVVLVPGYSYADGIAAGVWAAHAGIPVLLASDNATELPRRFVADHGITSGYVLGADRFISNSGANAIFSTDNI